MCFRRATAPVSDCSSRWLNRRDLPERTSFHTTCTHVPKCVRACVRVFGLFETRESLTRQNKRQLEDGNRTYFNHMSAFKGTCCSQAGASKPHSSHAVVKGSHKKVSRPVFWCLPSDWQRCVCVRVFFFPPSLGRFLGASCILIRFSSL